MFYKEHEPAHFHAEYHGQHGKFSFDGEMMAGNIRSRAARRLIRDWSRRHRGELKANWERMKDGRPLEGIEPIR